ncbi:MAG: ABC transporter substrate-binding protein [Spirochaetaceae bacterium]|nr:ABC transporter substrate-binding protein [Spirochaetaceae bacterium]
MNKKIVIPALLLSAAVSLWGRPQQETAGNELLIYSVVNEDETLALAELFTRQTGIKVEYFRAATGELVNRVIAERNAPQADILLGGAESLHISAARSGALDPYTSRAVRVPEYTRAADGTWTGFCVLTLGIGVNENRFAEKFPGKALPRTWDDLADPAFKGEIIFTDPVASATGYLFLQSQLQGRGEAQGWDYFRRLTPLAAQLPSSGSAPPRLIGSGEYSICVAYVHAMQLYAAQGFPVKIIIPPKTVGEVDAVSIIKGGPNSDNARKFVDFMLSREAQELFTSLSHTIPVNPEVASLSGSISVDTIDFLEYDSEKAGAERDAVHARWQNEIR